MSTEKLKQIYENYQEHRATASDGVKDTYAKMNNAFNEYLSEVLEDEFRNAFMYGYMYAKAENQKNGVA